MRSEQIVRKFASNDIPNVSVVVCYIIDKKMMSRWTAIAILNLNFQKKTE